MLLSLYIYNTNIKIKWSHIPMHWHDSGILALNAAVLIAVFALRLSVGGRVSCLPGQMNIHGGGGSEGVSEMGFSRQEGIVKDKTL